MTWQLEWTRQALRATAKSDRPTRQRIANAVEAFANTGHGDVKRLKGEHQGFLRLRVGGWRIILSEE